MRMMLSQKSLSLMLLLLPAAHRAAGALPDTLQVGGRCAVADASTLRLLVSVEDEAEARRMPATIEREGKTWKVETTLMPIVSLHHDALHAKEFGSGDITVAAPDGTAVAYSIQVRYRGESSLKYEKKSYAVKLLDEHGDDADASLLGMRSDNSWILDAMACDVARMRNRVSTDIWLDFARKPYYAASEPALVNGTRGRFVEAFVGGRYWGIYCLTEKVDRKQLRLKKFAGERVRGVGYKSFAYDTLLHPTEEPRPTDSVWMGWEPLYPDPEKGEPWTWEPLYALAQFLSQPEGSADVTAHLAERVDLPVWNDYSLFIDLLHGDDNTAKNMIVYYPDITASGSRVCICPWDMDATWGRSYQADPVGAETNCNVTHGVNYHVLLTLPDGFAEQCRRWRELRETFFTQQTLWPYFERYFQLFRESGAAKREVERWNGTDGFCLDFEAEEAYLKDWIERRLVYLDADYTMGVGGISGIGYAPAASDIYTIDGRPAGKDRGNLPRGIYIINGRKIVR